MHKEQIFKQKGYIITNDGVILNPIGKVINGHISNRGYLEISTKHNKKTIVCHVHRLQALQKYDMKLYNPGIVTRHLDNNKLNNSVENILIGTQSDNMFDNPIKERVQRAKHAASSNKKYNYDDIKQYHISNGKSYKKTMLYFNISSKGSLNYILKKITH